MTKLVDLWEEGSITNEETGWFMWRFDNKWRNWLIYVKAVWYQMTKLVDLCESSITNDDTGWFMWRGFDNKWRNWLIYVKKLR